VLVVWDAGATCGTAGLAARWFGRDGAPLGPPFVAADGVTARGAVVQPMALAPLAGGGLALRVNGAWVRRFEAPRLAGGPPPEWLAARPGRSIQVVRGGRAMAVAPPRRGEAFDVAAPCGADIEVLAPSGRSCGSAAFPGARCDGAGTLVGGEAAPSIGLDGTVVRAVGTEACAPGAPFPVCCRYRWWEGALR
jgi:hypothetical protein